MCIRDRAILKEGDAGLKVADVCRKHGISQPTYYNWKSKYGGLGVSELKRIKVRILSDQIYKRDSIFGQAMEIGTNEMAGFSWKDIDAMLEKMQTITPQQVQAVAQKYLVDAGLTIAVLDPQARKSVASKEGK